MDTGLCVAVDVNLPTGYDPAARLCGAERIEVSTLDELEANLARGRTAFILLMADRYDTSPTWLTLEQVAPLAAAAGVPVIVDAAADYPAVPNPYLTAGADLVAYSGGKILRGPQGGGLLLGRSDLLLAAAANAAPNHAFGRPLKVGKDIAVGMVVAVDALLNRRDVAVRMN
jgi:D-glucosaminate-6-phosphate ammonia-lyase